MIIEGYDLVNCCPHDIKIQDNTGKIWTIPEDKTNIIRIRSSFIHGTLGKFRDERLEMQIVENLPESHKNKYFVVSNPVAQLLRNSGVNRKDFRALGKRMYSSEEGEYRVGLISI